MGVNMSKGKSTSAGASVEESVAGSTASGSGVESGSAGRATGTVGGVDLAQDIGQAEAYTVNMKRLVAGELDFSEFMRTIAATDAGRRSANAADQDDRRGRNGEDNDDERAKLGNLALANAVYNSDQLAKIQLSERERTVRHSDLAIDRQWNVNETDALATALIAKVTEALGIKTTEE